MKLILNYAVGYLIAVTVAVIVTEALMIAPTVFPDNGRFGSFYRQMQDLNAMLMIGFIYTFGTALPGFLITVYVAHRKDLHSSRFYCIGGVLAAYLAHVILAAAMRGFFLPVYVVFVCSGLGGATGAYSYYRWRKRLVSRWSKNSEITRA